MRTVRRLVILSLLVAALAGLGIYLPRAFDHVLGASPLADVDAATDADSLASLPQDSTAELWDRLLFHPLDRAFTMPPKSLRRHGHKAQWLAPKGLPLHEYALGIEKACRRNGIRILDAREIRTSHTGFVRAEYALAKETAAGTDSLHLTLRIGEHSVPGSARMALVFVGLDSIDLSDAALLRQTPVTLNLGMDPFNGNPALQALKTGGGQIHLLAEIPMEPIAYPYINPGKNAIYLHFNDEQIRANLDKALDHMKEVRGIVTRHGDRAIESRPLLKRLFQYLAPHHLPLLDVTGSPRSLARDVAGETGGLAHRGWVVKDSTQFETEFAKRVAQAVKASESVLVLQYSRSGFRALLKLVEEREGELEDMGLAFVPFNHLNRPPKAADDIDGAVEKPQPAPPKN
jgi:polysaccharide deacetylase 2 family uncharacterized protein YibQ